MSDFDWLEPTYEQDVKEAKEMADNVYTPFQKGNWEVCVGGFKVNYSKSSNKAYLSLLLKGLDEAEGCSQFRNEGFEGSPQKYLWKVLETANIDTAKSTFGSPCDYPTFLNRIGEALVGKYYNITVDFESKPKVPGSPELEIKWMNKSRAYHQLNKKTTLAMMEQKMNNNIQQASVQSANPNDMSQMVNAAPAQSTQKTPKNSNGWD